MENDSVWHFKQNVKMTGVCKKEWEEQTLVLRDIQYSVCLTCMWKHMARVCNCYCWIIILYTPSTQHCWKVLFIYLWECEDESSTSGLVLYPQRNWLFSQYRLDFVQQSGPQAPLLPTVAPVWKESVSKCVSKSQNIQYKDAKESENENSFNPKTKRENERKQKWCSLLFTNAKLCLKPFQTAFSNDKFIHPNCRTTELKANV